LAVVDETGIALGAGHGDVVAVRDGVECIAAADHGRHAQFSRDDRGMTGAPAAIGHDRRGTFHDRFPVRVGHVGHQHVARLQLVHFGDRADHARLAGTDLVADRAAFAQHRALAAQVEALELSGAATRLHRFRTRLDDEEFSGDAVLCPLHIHRTAVVLLDHQRLLRQFVHIGIGDREAVLQFLRRGFGPHAFARCIRIDHANLLRAELTTQDGRFACAQRGLVDVELVRIDGALDDGFAEAVTRGHEHGVAKAGLGVEREQHARGAHVGADHQLHAGREKHVLMLEAMMHPIGNRTVVVEGREDFPDPMQHVLDADDVEEGLLLPCERGIGQVFGRGRANALRH
jgi:hypothetical protein